jgi:hypothetical protein
VATLAAITLRADTGVAPLAGMGLELLPDLHLRADATLRVSQ